MKTLTSSIRHRRVFVRAFSVVIATFSLSVSHAGESQTGSHTAALSSVFGTTDPALQTFTLGGAGVNSVTAQPDYKELMEHCRVFGAPTTCDGKIAFGTVESVKASESQKAMNRMVILGAMGNRRYQNLTVQGGNVTYDTSKIGDYEIGFINLTYFKGNSGLPFSRCDAEIVACGSKVVGCPSPQKAAYCAPVVAENSFTNANCVCTDPAKPVLSSCVNNVASCIAPPSTGTTCTNGQIADGDVCKKPWTCLSTDAISAADQTNLANTCTSTTIPVSPVSTDQYYPSSMTCSGTKKCDPTVCQPGNFAKSSTQCQQCDAGTYAPSAGLTSCLACPSGSVTDAIGMSECKPCPAGSYSAADGKSCVQCAAGTYQDSKTGASSCLACPITPQMGASPTGMVASGPVGSDSASKCTTTITSCVAGYELSSDKKSCVQIPASPGNNTTCGKGTFLASGFCVPCQTGTYMDMENHTNNICKPCAIDNGSFIGGGTGAKAIFSDPADPTGASCGMVSCNSDAYLSGTGQNQKCVKKSCAFAMVASPSAYGGGYIGFLTAATVPAFGIAISPFVDGIAPGGSIRGASTYAETSCTNPSGYGLGDLDCNPNYQAFQISCTNYYSWTGWYMSPLGGSPYQTNYASDRYSNPWGYCHQFNGYPCYESCPDKTVTIEGKSMQLPQTVAFNPSMSSTGLSNPTWAANMQKGYYAYAKVAKGGGDRTLCDGKDNGDDCTLTSGGTGSILRVKYVGYSPVVQKRYRAGYGGGQGYEYRCVWEPTNGDSYFQNSDFWEDIPDPKPTDFCTCMPK